MFDVSLFFPISPSAPLLFLAASLHPLSGRFAQLVPVAHHSALPVSYCYGALPCPIHVSHLPLLSIVVAHAVCCLFSLSFSFCLILPSVSVSMLLFCTPSVGWLRWLFSIFSVHRGRLLLFSFISGPSGIIIRDRNNFLLETIDQQPATSRAACGQGGRAARGARAARSVSGTRRGAGSATCSR